MTYPKKLTFFSETIFILSILAISSACKPTNPYYYYKQGEDQYKRGDYAQAEKFYQEALKRKPDLAEGYYGLGLVYYQQRKIDDAIKMFQKARSLKPEIVEAYYQEAMIYQLMGGDRKFEAIPLYEKVLEIKPDFREARLNLAMIYENMGAFEQARDVYQAGVTANPNDSEMKAGLERVLEKMPPSQPEHSVPPPEEKPPIP